VVFTLDDWEVSSDAWRYRGPGTSLPVQRALDRSRRGRPSRVRRPWSGASAPGSASETNWLSPSRVTAETFW